MEQAGTEIGKGERQWNEETYLRKVLHFKNNLEENYTPVLSVFILFDGKSITL